MDQITADYKACKSGDKDAAIRLYQSMKNILLTTAFGVLREKRSGGHSARCLFASASIGCRL